MAMTFPSNPTTGQQYSVSGGPTYTWDGTVWKILTPGSQFSEQQFTATAGQTSFTVSGGYVIGAVDVYRNGVKLVVGVDFLATDLSTVTLVNAAAAGDTIEVVKAAQILYADALKATNNLSDVGNAATARANLGAVSKAGDTITGSLNVTGGMGVGTASPDSDLDVNGGGMRLIKAKAITQLGLPNLGTYKGYLLLAKAYTSGNFDQSHVNGTFYIKRGSASSGNRTDVCTVASNTAYLTDNLFVQVIATASKFFSRTCKVVYSGTWYHAIETTIDGGNPDYGVWFAGTFYNCTPIYVDATYVSNVTDYGTSTQVWNADGSGYGSILEITNGIFSLPKGQLKFPAAQNASSDPNTLDDYEEGTWTPVLQFGGASVGITYSQQNGNYTKVGNFVIARAYIALSNKGSSTGNATLSGLPFTSKSVGSGYAAIKFYMNGMTGTSGGDNGYFAPGSTVLQLCISGTGNNIALNNTNYSNSMDHVFTVCYQTD